VTPRRRLAEIRMDHTSAYEGGQGRKADIFEGIPLADLTGPTKGRRSAGAMRRHGCAGQRAAHGDRPAHRRVGRIGACATPARVFEGTRMAGRMGRDRVTTQNLKIQKIDAESNLLLIKGAIPGARGGLVTVTTAVTGGAHA